MIENATSYDKKIETLGFRRALQDRVCSRTDFPNNRQNVHTPYELCYEMVDKLESNTSLLEKTYLTINLEFIETLCYDFGVDRKNIWFVTDCQQKANVCKHERYSGVNVIVTDYLSWKTDMKFDVIVGNPPYNPPSNKQGNGCGGRQILWDQFVDKAFNKLKSGGYLCYIHPPMWRKPDGVKWKEITSRQIKFLRILGENESKKLFGVGTKVDWYIIKNQSTTEASVVMDENGELHNVNFKYMNFLPSYCISEIKNVLANENEQTCDVIYNYNYGANVPRDWMSEKKVGKFIHPVINSITLDGISCLYSNTTTRGHFGISKVILPASRHLYPVNDFGGNYATTENCFSIEISSQKEGDLIISAINTSKFKDIIKATKWSSFRTDYKMFKFFKKDFWKHFVDDNGNELP